MQKRYILYLHSAVLLFGFAGLLGKLISEPPVVIVFSRTILAAIVLFVILKWQGEPVTITCRKDIFGFIGMGALLALHWLSFFQAIQVSTIAIGLLTYASFPVFVTLIEPAVFKTGLKFRDVLFAMIVMTGLLVIMPEYDFTNQITVGVLWGVLSGLSFAFLTVSNKRYSETYSSLKIAFYQNSIAAVILLPFFLIVPKQFTPMDIANLIILGVVCTALAHTLFIYSMRSVRAFTAGIAAALEPVYGMLLAIIVLGEIPSLRTIIGGLIILFIVGIVSAQSD